MISARSYIKISFFSLLLLTSIAVDAQFKDDSITKSIFFGGGSYYIDDEQVVDLGRWLDSIPNLLEKYQIQIISHTDNIGGLRYNQWLSEMRSQMVHGILIQKDIPERIIHIKDWGLENPVYSNDSYQGLRMNRRVDVVLHPVVF
ncbi:MAG: OmpA family protein [Bacteroidetes bacterium]|nr:OmpA family protein [Bacteroidota bacterium]MBI3481915.1 OmpA family protein [Bacteroidota bacterium]